MSCRAVLLPAFACALIAAILRLILHSQAELGPLVLDQARFVAQAAAIRAGEGAGEGPYLTSPLYPYLLALLGGAGPLRILQLVLGALTAGLAAFSATRRFGPCAGWVAGLALATFGPAMHYEAQLLVAGPLAFLMILALALEPDEPGPRHDLRGAAAGIALGLAAALRPTALVPALALGLVTLARGQRRSAAALMIGLTLAVLPFTLRNAAVGGETVLLSAGGGFNLWVGNHEGAPGVFDPPPGYDFALDPAGVQLARTQAGEDLRAGEASAWWRARAFEELGANPGAAAARFGRKAILLLHPEEIPQLGPDDFRPVRARHAVLRTPLDGRWLLLLALCAPLVLLTGADRERRLRVAAPLAAPLAMALAYGGVVVLFFVSGRFRLPLLPLAAVLAGGGIEGLRALPRRRLVAVGVMFAALAACSLVLYRDGGPYAMGEPGTRTSEARELASQGRHAEAAHALRQLLAADPSHARAGLDLGQLLMGPLLGETHADKVAAWREAETVLAGAVAAQPDLAEGWFYLGVARLNLSRGAEATAALETALRGANGSEEWYPEAERALAAARGGGG